MRDEFENIRAERETSPLPRQQLPANSYAGLWKQIALGIIVGYSVVGILSAVGWLVFAKLALGALQIHVP
jgi:hypothetical protein